MPRDKIEKAKDLAADKAISEVYAFGEAGPVYEFFYFLEGMGIIILIPLLRKSRSLLRLLRRGCSVRW